MPATAFALLFVLTPLVTTQPVTAQPVTTPLVITQDLVFDGEPLLLRKGDGYLIHALSGSISSFLARPTLCGIVLTHVDIESGKMKVLAKSGTYAQPTRRVSYSFSRIVGVLQVEGHLVLLVAGSGGLSMDEAEDQSGESVPLDRITYHLEVFDMRSGERRCSLPFDDPSFFPGKLPTETLEAGLLDELEGSAFAIFGKSLRVRDDGSLEEIESEEE